MSDELDGDDEAGGDESKTRKHVSSIAIRFTHLLTRTGYIWPILLIALAIFIVLSVFIQTRDLVCISASSSDHVSRLRFFGFDGLETDFGSLGVPWYRNKEKLLSGRQKIYSEAWRSLCQYMKLGQSRITCMEWGLTTALGFGLLLDG